MLADMNVSNIYVSKTVSQLYIIYVSWCKINSQNYVSDKPYFNHILMNNYKREILTTFMLALLLYVIRSLNLLYLEILSNIKC